MLSRVAERIYWMCRYLERAENTARLVAVYRELLMDLPGEARLDWQIPLNVLGLNEAWNTVGQEGNELEFLLCGPENHASLLSSLHQARENARTTRDVMPSEAWLAINELHLFAQQALRDFSSRSGIRATLEIIRRCHEITGIIESAISRGPVYQYICLGHYLERADMTSRMIDVAASTLLSRRDELEHYSSMIWRGVLRAQSAYQMYRQHVRRRIVGEDVVTFLLLDRDFPRSVAYCIDCLQEAAGRLPRHDEAKQEIRQLQERLATLDLEDINHASVNRLVDDLQIELAALNNTVFETWLNPVRIA
jgi:uncharacterized alpha-E superfamily protein